MKITKTSLQQLIREETERAIKEGEGEDYEESLELQLKRARRDGLEGEEAYRWAKKNLRSLGIHPPINKPALGRETDPLEEIEDEGSGLADSPVFSDVPEDKREELAELDEILNLLLTAHEAARVNRRIQDKIQEAIDTIQEIMGEDYLGI